MSLRGRSCSSPEAISHYDEIAHRTGVRRKCRREEHPPRNDMTFIIYIYFFAKQCPANIYPQTTRADRPYARTTQSHPS